MSTLGHPYTYIITLINIPRRKKERERDWLLFLFQSGSLLRLRTLAFWKAGISPTVRLAISTTQVCVGIKGEKSCTHKCFVKQDVRRFYSCGFPI